MKLQKNGPACMQVEPSFGAFMDLKTTALSYALIDLSIRGKSINRAWICGLVEYIWNLERMTAYTYSS